MHVKRKMNEFPVQEIKGIRLGVQPHGLIMRQQMGMQEGVGAIGWKDIYEWYNTPEFLLIKFKVKGQEGAYFCQNAWIAKTSRLIRFLNI